MHAHNQFLLLKMHMRYMARAFLLPKNNGIFQLPKCWLFSTYGTTIWCLWVPFHVGIKNSGQKCWGSRFSELKWKTWAKRIRVVVFDGEKHSHMHRLALVCVSKVLLHWMWKHCDRFSWEYADFSSLEKLINAVSAHTWPAVLTLFWLNVLCACDSMHLSACVTSSRSICGSAPLHQTWYSGNRSLSMYSSCTWARYVMQLTVFVAAYVCMW